MKILEKALEWKKLAAAAAAATAAAEPESGNTEISVDSSEIENEASSLGKRKIEE
jgi:hypothetical protein